MNQVFGTGTATQSSIPSETTDKLPEKVDISFYGHNVNVNDVEKSFTFLL